MITKNKKKYNNADSLWSSCRRRSYMCKINEKPFLIYFKITFGATEARNFLTESNCCADSKLNNSVYSKGKRTPKLAKFNILCHNHPTLFINCSRQLSNHTFNLHIIFFFFTHIFLTVVIRRHVYDESVLLITS